HTRYCALSRGLGDVYKRQLYNSSSLSNEYIVGNKYLLPATTPTNRLANFEIYGVVDLENNNEPHVAGIYKDTVSIMITW
ncbi:spore coat protein U domain-containing protein, partial [Acinetobacter baumannii]|uniref:spore coat protein U domain-containing protein n=1 Tax=Acinetobacter baumannii TaxID=470 RepID=UPI0039F07262